MPFEKGMGKGQQNFWMKARVWKKRVIDDLLLIKTGDISFLTF